MPGGGRRGAASGALGAGGRGLSPGGAVAGRAVFAGILRLPRLSRRALIWARRCSSTCFCGTAEPFRCALRAFPRCAYGATWRAGAIRLRAAGNGRSRRCSGCGLTRDLSAASSWTAGGGCWRGQRPAGWTGEGRAQTALTRFFCPDRNEPFCERHIWRARDSFCCFFMPEMV